MKYFAVLAMGLSLSAFGQSLVDKLAAVEREVAWRDSMVLGKIASKFKKNSQNHLWKLEKNRNYRLYLVFERELDKLHPQLQIYANARLDPAKGKYRSVGFYYWSFKSFRRSNAVLSLKIDSRLIGSKYALLLAGGGRETPEDFARTAVTGSQGKFYRLIDNVVYRDGKKYYYNRKYRIASLCIASGGKLYMRTKDGSALSKDGVIFKSTRRIVLKVVASRSNKVYFLCDDASVLDQRGRIAYKRTRDERVVDLQEENGYVWTVALNGRRMPLQ